MMHYKENWEVNDMNKSCEHCQYNGPYWGINNPCENCPNNDFTINGKVPIIQPLRETTDHVSTTTTDMKALQINYGKNTGDVSVTVLSSGLPTADEYRKSIGVPYYYQRKWSEPKYICPECGGGMCRNEGIVLASNPPQCEYKCNKCGHIEYQFG